jgi:Cu-Zn family superoxide dismutase
MYKHGRYKSFKFVPALILTLAPLVASGAREPGNGPDRLVADADEQPLNIEINAASTTENERKQLGVVQATQLAKGVLFEPALEGLSPGLHGFHIHENGSCGSSLKEDPETANPLVKPVGEAGDHYDPGLKGNHAGPWGQGHLGDLPNLQVEDDGTTTLPVYAPRVTLRDLEGRALVIHASGDNYTDEPDSKGGSGQAVACGVANPEK